MLEGSSTELTFKGPIDMGGSKRGFEEGTSGNNGHSLVNLINDGHQASFFLDLDLRNQERQERSILPGCCSHSPWYKSLHHQPPRLPVSSVTDHTGQVFAFPPRFIPSFLPLSLLLSLPSFLLSFLPSSFFSFSSFPSTDNTYR